jgi:hypothetical protein
MIRESNLMIGDIVPGKVLNGRGLEFFVKFKEDDIIHDKLRQE